MLTKLPYKKAIPIIGMVSSGKSTFLNSLLGIEILEAKDDITTKFVCIIRYNKNIKNPLFYHVKLEKIENKDDYIYIKDGKTAEGLEEIKKMISNINNENKEENSEPQYDNLFYVLETDISNIENKEFLSKYDFYDIPGLNEYIKTEGNNIKDNKTDEQSEINEIITKPNINEDSNFINQENEINEKMDEESSNLSEAPPTQSKKSKKETDEENESDKSKENMKYIKGIFQYIKNKIDFGIIIIDSGKYYKPQNIQIISELHYNMNIQFLNFLFVLNKIDLVKNSETTKQKCRDYFIKKLDSTTFNIEYNVFVAIDSFQLKNEMNMKTDFLYFFKYYFNIYYKKSKEFKTPTPDDKEQLENFSFVNFISTEITRNIPEKREEYLENLAAKVQNEDFNSVIKIYEKLKSEQSEVINFGIDLEKGEDDEDDNESIIILKAFYECFKEKILSPEYSEDVRTILNYFNDFSQRATNEMETIQPPLITKEEEAISNFKLVFEGLKKYENEEKNIIELLAIDLNKLEKIIYNKKKIFIPFIGVSSAGKSTILNCIVGDYIFPESQEECTTRGIILQHNFEDKTELYETDLDPTCDYFIFKERSSKPVSKGKSNVTRYLTSLNSYYSTNQKKHFFILKTPIKLFEILQLSDDLRKRTSFIDLPGGDTDENILNQIKNENEMTVYQKLIHISTSFCFINKGRAIKLQENDLILKKLFHESHMNSQIINEKDFLKNCLFVLNEFAILTEEEKNIHKIKIDLENVLYNTNQNKELEKNINVSIFNALKYSQYLQAYHTYCNLSFLFPSITKAYLNQFDFGFGIKLFQETNYVKFAYGHLKKIIKNITNIIDEKNKCDDNYLNIVRSLITDEVKIVQRQITSKDNSTIVKIANILYNFKKNIKGIKFYKESYCEDFFKQLYNQIINSDELLNKQYNEYLDETFKYLDKFFNQDFEQKKNIKTEDLNSLNKSIEPDVRNIFEKYNFKDIFQIYEERVITYLKVQKEDANKILTNNDNDVEKSLNSIMPGMQKIIDGFEKEINSNADGLVNDIEELKKKIKDAIQKAYESNKEMVNIDNKFDFGKFDVSFLETLYNHLGLVGGVIAGGIGASLAVAILGLNMVPGIGTIISVIAGLGALIIGAIFGPSKEEKFKNSVDKMMENVKSGFTKQKTLFLKSLEALKTKLIETLQKEIGIIAFNLEEGEKKEFEENKNLYFKTKEILLNSK